MGYGRGFSQVLIFEIQHDVFLSEHNFRKDRFHLWFSRNPFSPSSSFTKEGLNDFINLSFAIVLLTSCYLNFNVTILNTTHNTVTIQNLVTIFAS